MENEKHILYKKIIFILLVSCILLGCARSDVKKREISLDEWVSPDGVHYWFREGIYLAPRYDSDGNLVIDGR